MTKIPYNQKTEAWKQQHRDINRRWKQRHRDKVRQWKREYYQRHNERIKKQQAEKQKHQKQIINAQRLAEKHTALGKYCEECGSIEGLERHHPNYNQPLNVITLCKSCHRKIHVPF